MRRIRGKSYNIIHSHDITLEMKPLISTFQFLCAAKPCPTLSFLPRIIRGKGLGPRLVQPSRFQRDLPDYNADSRFPDVPNSGIIQIPIVEKLYYSSRRTRTQAAQKRGRGDSIVGR